ncbi:cupin domain-containing protein [Lysobacter soyae]|uniref:Cupin domain-containing protein n=1 Tax=Lysobacter soyae TaxID=2764185 RepID=A0ABX8WPY8_9GAMM|nr:cupin domain-containing protein [Lysobacter sp. CJ11]QYR52119.1 cupin domain-containing protein [Lysobacter sp. CJ11]
MAGKKTPPVEVDARDFPILGMPAQQFLDVYWQRHPLLIRNAFPDFESPISAEDLAGLACEDSALSRIVSRNPTNDTWQVRNGPFLEDEFPNLPRKDWTLLVQDVDKWDADVRALLYAFEFLPRWRMDDIMVSFAAPGGSVGAHIDNYDVFLLQGVGQRRWLIDTKSKPDQTYRDDVPLRLLKHFNPDQDWVLNPGDMLYVPPGVPHHGIGVDACVTISVGLRAPSSAELVDELAGAMVFDAPETIRYEDPGVSVPADPYEIDDAALDRAVEAIHKLRIGNRSEFAEWFGRVISSYRVAANMAPDADSATGADIVQSVAEGHVWTRHPYSRAAWTRQGKQAQLFVNGMAFDCSVKDASAIAAAEFIDAALIDALGTNGRQALQTLADAGHYMIEDDHESFDAV